MNIYLTASVTAFLYMTLFFCIAQYKKDNSLVDIAWGTGFILIAWVTLWYTNVFLWRQIIVTTLVSIWGSRLAFHIFKRHKGEDPRYVEMRKRWGKDVVVKSFFYIFMLQGLLLLIISYPIIAINADTTMKTLSLLDFLGVAIWIFGFCFEALADHQLQEFIRNPSNKGKVMGQGLWRYSRHPNYFGESLMWWAIFCLALSVPFGWSTVISPLTITFLLLYVSGVPLLEKQFADNPEYTTYKSRTNMFFPWFFKVGNS